MRRDSFLFFSQFDARIKLFLALAILLVIAATTDAFLLTIGLFIALVSLIQDQQKWSVFRRSLFALLVGPTSLIVFRGVDAAPLAAAIFMKTVLSLFVVLVLTQSTPVMELLAAAQRLRFPKTLLAIIALALRYLGVLEEESERMRKARAARSVRLHRWTEWRILSHSIGILFIRALERAERVHQAMLCRGWKGEFHLLGPSETAVDRGSERDSGGETTWPSSKSAI